MLPGETAIWNACFFWTGLLPAILLDCRWDGHFALAALCDGLPLAHLFVPPKVLSQEPSAWGALCIVPGFSNLSA